MKHRYTHMSLPLSFKTERRRCQRNRYTPDAVAVMKENRRAWAWLIAGIVLLPAVMAGVFLLLKHYQLIR